MINRGITYIYIEAPVDTQPWYILYRDSIYESYSKLTNEIIDIRAYASLKSRETMNKWKTNKNIGCISAYDEELLVGFMHFNELADEIYLAEGCVHPKYYRQGIATNMYIILSALNKNINLVTRKFNKRVINMFINGEPVSVEDFGYNEKYIGLKMRARL